MAVLDVKDEHGGYLRGHLLVATPALKDGCFDKSVIYVCEHNEHGAMGVVVNRPIANIRLGEILQVLEINSNHEIADLPVYFGGPVEGHRGFVLHTSDVTLPDTVIGVDGVCLTAHVSMLRGMANGTGPRESFLVLGYAGWQAGQLEAELENGSWLTVPATRDLVFHTDDAMKWSLSAASVGVVDLGRLSSVVGHA